MQYDTGEINKYKVGMNLFTGLLTFKYFSTVIFNSIHFFSNEITKRKEIYKNDIRI
jgi:hypothetical protein